VAREDDDASEFAVWVRLDEVGARVLELVGTSRDVPFEALSSSSSGFAMRKPPKDCERLKSFSMLQRL
jgi:hypothetical protein